MKLAPNHVTAQSEDFLHFATRTSISLSLSLSLSMTSSTSAASTVPVTRTSKRKALGMLESVLAHSSPVAAEPVEIKRAKAATVVQGYDGADPLTPEESKALARHRASCEFKGNYEMDGIVERGRIKGKPAYRIAWIGYGPEHDTMEPAALFQGDNLTIAKGEMLRDLAIRENKQKQRKPATFKRTKWSDFYKKYKQAFDAVPSDYINWKEEKE